MSSGPTVFNELRVRRLVIEDKDGEGKIILMTTPDGSLAIGLRDTEGQVRLQLILLDGTEPKVLLTDNERKGRVQLTVDVRRNAGVTVFHDNDRPWFTANTDGHHHYFLCVFDRENEFVPTWVGQIEPR